MIRLFCTLILFLVITFAVGLMWIPKENNKKVNLMQVMVCGVVVLLAGAQVLTVPAIYGRLSLSGLTFLFLTICIIFALFELVYKREAIRRLFVTMQSIRLTSILPLIFMVLVAVQMFSYVFWGHVDDDDAFYVATATTAVTTDSMYQYSPYTGDPLVVFPARYVLSPFPMFYAMISRISGVSATVVAHTVMPVFWIAFAYAIYYMIGLVLFKENIVKIHYFLIVLSIIHIFSAGARHMQGTMLLTRIWQGKAILATCLLPLCFWTMLYLHDKVLKKKDYLWMILLMLACCFVSSMGIALGAVAMGIYAVTLLLCTKDGKRFLMTLCCCIPNVVYAVIYILIR